ncbi:MAG TPA: hypothetical protein VGA09_05500 [Candidatus Binatia bacterium]
MKKAAAPLILVAAMLLSVEVTAQAQQPKKVPRIGYVSFGGVRNSVRVEAFRQGLRQLGYAEGKDIVVEYRFAEGKLDRLNEQAAELVRLKVEVIVAGGPAPTPKEQRPRFPLS